MNVNNSLLTGPDTLLWYCVFFFLQSLRLHTETELVVIYFILTDEKKFAMFPQSMTV